MKGMSFEQYKEVLEFVQTHHSFGRYRQNPEYQDLKIKYVDSCYDSRDKSIWSVSFRGMSGNFRFASNHFNVINPPPKQWKYNNLFDLCIAYLKGEFRPKKEFLINDRNAD